MKIKFKVFFVALFVSSISCAFHKPIPKFDKIIKINATLFAVPELSIESIECIEIPFNKIEEFSKLITPNEHCNDTILHSFHFLVAKITLYFKNNTTADIYVRWTGHNPAALSLDDKKFYNGSIDVFPDGALGIVRVLKQYNFESKK